MDRRYTPHESDCTRYWFIQQLCLNAYSVPDDTLGGGFIKRYKKIPGREGKA